jgi:hypothetical protein
MPEPLVERAGGLLRAEVEQELRGGREEHRVPGRYRRVRDVLREEPGCASDARHAELTPPTGSNTLLDARAREPSRMLVARRSSVKERVVAFGRAPRFDAIEGVS